MLFKEEESIDEPQEELRLTSPITIEASGSPSNGAKRMSSSNQNICIINDARKSISVLSANVKVKEES